MRVILKLIAAITVAITFFIIGILQLINLKHNEESLPLRMVIDFEPQCNDNDYLEFGSSEEDTFVNLGSQNKVIVNDAEQREFASQERFSIIKDGETLHSILRNKNVSEQEIASLSLALRPHLLAKDLAANDFYRFDLGKIDQNNSFIKGFVIRKLDQNRLPILYHVIRADDDANNVRFVVNVKAPKITEERAVLKLKVGQTLYSTFNELPFGTELMQRFMAIFTWEMRMPREINRDDEIEIVVIKKYALNEFIGFGQIQSVYFRQKNRTQFATFFTSKDKKIQGFFNEDGRSLEKEFALSPVFETTATSNQRRRLHPVRKIYVSHNGTDYRGKIGTEFFSIADGEIIEKRFDENVGNMIRIRHNYGVHSEYFHADTLVQSLKVGDRVKRGQILGTIGRTGRLCTGPHLHMGLYRLQGNKRKFLELASLRKTLKPLANITASHKMEFDSHVKTMMALLEKPKLEQIAQSGSISN